ncbi:hypothetical protein Syun_027587 [Stephania yunnanensis]|uniref:Aminotransferase class I/classII large domain-containing protein n=1 Tax=Stephania yunnanensis TaxID=152371 RepID=A0AAP0EFU6_9MAGN
MKLCVFDQMEMGVNKCEANSAVSDVSIRGILGMLKGLCDSDDRRAVIQLGHGDPSVFPCFRTSQIAEDAIVDAIRSGKFNSYAPSFGLPPARRAVGEFLSRDLPYNMSSDDIFLTVGCIQAIEIVVSALAHPRANILLPRPGFPLYESHAALNGIEIRHFDLLPNKSWEVDLESVESLADENTVALVIINPGNPCGTVFSYQHLLKIAETAKKLGICVVSDEVYGHITFRSKPFVPMGVFGSIVPVVTLGSLSKRWIVPGWRIGWIAMNDCDGVLKQTEFVDKIKGLLSVSSDPPTFVQVQLHVSKLEDIIDDSDFCIKLAKEESVIVLPGPHIPHELSHATDQRPFIQLGHGDPSAFPSFRTARINEDAIVDAVKSRNFNSYAPALGLLPTRRAIAEYLSADLPYMLSLDDILVTTGGRQSIRVVLSALAGSGTANVLLPKPGYPFYEITAKYVNLEFWHFNLLPESGWEVDLDSLESLADENTVAMVVINPGNPCGNVYSYQHLYQIAETAKKLGIFVISDEAYAHLAFGNKPFVPMGVFGSIVPVFTLGTLSKRWIVPGWRLESFAMSEPRSALKETKVKLDVSDLEVVRDDMELCMKLAKEEAVIVLPGEHKKLKE